MKYGIFGGTFDPPHIGHTEIARAAMEQLDLDEVILVPAGKNPMKTRKSSPPKHRLAMCRLAIAEQPGMAVSDIETTRNGPSYLINTLEELTVVMPGEYWFILGADALETFSRWKEPEKILRMCCLAAVSRPATDLATILSRIDPEIHRSIEVIETPLKSVSSSFIRDCIRRGEPYADLVTPAVYEYIQKNKLYND